jgi:hypothetical protein
MKRILRNQFQFLAARCDMANVDTTVQSAPKVKLTAVERLKLAQERADKLNKRVGALKYKVEHGERAKLTQVKCSLGGVLLQLAARGEPEDRLAIAVVRKYLLASSASATDSNLTALAGTAFVSAAVDDESDRILYRLNADRAVQAINEDVMRTAAQDLAESRVEAQFRGEVLS